MHFTNIKSSSLQIKSAVADAGEKFKRNHSNVPIVKASFLKRIVSTSIFNRKESRGPAVTVPVPSQLLKPRENPAEKNGNNPVKTKAMTICQDSGTTHRLKKVKEEENEKQSETTIWEEIL